MPYRIMFLSPMCLLDNTSGAAISVKNFLEALAAAGHEARSFTASLFDPKREVRLEPYFGRQGADDAMIGKLLRIPVNGVTHGVLRLASTQGSNFSAHDAALMRRLWELELEKHPPDLLISYGSTSFTQSLQNRAREMGIPLVFYLGNAEYKKTECFADNDIVVTPSNFLKDHYKETLGLNARVVRTIMNPERLIEPSELSVANDPRQRHLGFVTFVNAAAEKGLTLFARLSQMARKALPDLKFLVIEGRSDRKLLQEAGVDIGALPNVWWLPSQLDVREIYRRTAVLLVPSFWREGMPRTVLEGQLCGLPILATRRGGIPEALNGGGFLFDMPPGCGDKFTRVPSKDEVAPWLATLTRLWQDEAFYAEATARARTAGQTFHPSTTAPAAVSFFESIIDGTYGNR